MNILNTWQSVKHLKKIKSQKILLFYRKSFRRLPARRLLVMCHGLFCSSNLVVFNPKNGYRSYYLCVKIVSEQPVIVFLSVLNWFPST